jgi:hypothetical protein
MPIAERRFAARSLARVPGTPRTRGAPSKLERGSAHRSLAGRVRGGTGTPDAPFAPMSTKKRIRKAAKRAKKRAVEAAPVAVGVAIGFGAGIAVSAMSSGLVDRIRLSAKRVRDRVRDIDTTHARELLERARAFVRDGADEVRGMREPNASIDEPQARDERHPKTKNGKAGHANHV